MRTAPLYFRKCLLEGVWSLGWKEVGKTEGTYHYLEAVARWEVTGA